MNKKRILIKEVSGNCRHLREVDSLTLAHLFALNEVGNYCSANGWKRTNGQCKNCNKAEYVGITREQAIEKMAIGLFKVDNVLALDIKWEQLEKSTRLTYKVFAEAVLNALLEVNNGN